MIQFSLISFLGASLPEEFFMALFAWAVLGKKDCVKFRNVLLVAIITAISFVTIKIITRENLLYYPILQVIIFALVIYFLYRLSYIEAIVGALLTTVLMSLVQITVVGIGMTILGLSSKEVNENDLMMIALLIPEHITIGLCSLVLYKKNIHIFNFKKRKLSEFHSDKIRYLVLQLTFTLLIILFYFVLFLNNVSSFEDNNSKALLVINFLLILLFTIISIKSAFEIGESIQKEEEHKRKLDGIEIIQNIDYLCTLLDDNQISEVKTILKSMKRDVDAGIINNRKIILDESPFGNNKK